MYARHFSTLAMAAVLFLSFCVASPAPTISSKSTSSTKSTTTSKATSTPKTSSTKTSTSSTSTSTVYNTFTYDANFDDIANSNPTGPTQQIGVYKSLYYQGFALNTVLTVPPTTGVIPNSGNQFAVFGSVLGTAEGQAMMTVDYQGSTILFFHLSSFYYGCALATAEGVLGVPTSCTINLVAVDVKGNTLAAQSFNYAPTGVVAQMSYAQLSSAFQTQQVYAISYTITNAGTNAALTVGMIDTAIYTVYGSGAISGNS